MVSCDKAPKFPTKTILEVDLENQACGEYEVTDAVNMKYVHVRDLPLEACQGVFGFGPKDIPKIQDWIVDMNAYGKQHCK